MRVAAPAPQAAIGATMSIRIRETPGTTWIESRLPLPQRIAQVTLLGGFLLSVAALALAWISDGLGAVLWRFVFGLAVELGLRDRVPAAIVAHVGWPKVIAGVGLLTWPIGAAWYLFDDLRVLSIRDGRLSIDRLSPLILDRFELGQVRVRSVWSGRWVVLETDRLVLGIGGAREGEGGFVLRRLLERTGVTSSGPVAAIDPNSPAIRPLRALRPAERLLAWIPLVVALSCLPFGLEGARYVAGAVGIQLDVLFFMHFERIEAALTPRWSAEPGQVSRTGGWRPSRTWQVQSVSYSEVFDARNFVRSPAVLVTTSRGVERLLLHPSSLRIEGVARWISERAGVPLNVPAPA